MMINLVPVVCSGHTAPANRNIHRNKHQLLRREEKFVIEIKNIHFSFLSLRNFKKE